MSPSRRSAGWSADRESGQIAVLLVGMLLVLLVGAVLLGGVAVAMSERGERQRVVDLAALAGARALREAHPRLYEPATLGGRPNPRRLSRPAYDALGRDAARRTAAGNGQADVTVTLVEAAGAPPVRLRVATQAALVVGGVEVAPPTVAEAELVPDAGAALGPQLGANAGEYAGPVAMRQGKPMRPDVALAFDRMAAAARADGHHLLVVSALRTDAEQAVLFARNPDPKWVAPPGRSLHRLGTELDLGPNSAWPWLAANAQRFGFLKRYSWEPWHFGYIRNAGSASVGFAAKGPKRGSRESDGGDGPTGATLPAWVPDAYAPLIARAAMRWNVSGALLAAQLRQESGFNPQARSPAGAQGIAQFMPGTAAAYGLRNPFDPAQAIDAQARLMRDLLRQFGAVPLALAAYNAGPGNVAPCGCIPPFPETVAYVAAILGMLSGAGDLLGGGFGLEVRLVR